MPSFVRNPITAVIAGFLRLFREEWRKEEERGEVENIDEEGNEQVINYGASYVTNSPGFRHLNMT